MSATLFTASDVCRWARVNRKTVHNWVAKGHLPAGRTPGRRLRFRPADVKALLERMGAPVPDEVAQACESAA